MNLIEREMKKRWLDELFSTNRDPYFYVGNGWDKGTGPLSQKHGGTAPVCS